MKSNPIIVLKFGSSILRTTDDLSRVTHEIYRWVRDGWRVVAVVSALDGRTDQLLDLAKATNAGTADGVDAAWSTALLASTGELESAALLGLALDRAGVPATVLTHHSAVLRTTSSALDARPVSLNAEAVRRQLDERPVAVIPGFVGVDEQSRTCLLGRGGSDLTALFVAEQLGAERCRLVKDVDGLYDRDPAIETSNGPRPRRFDDITFDDALKLDGRIVQHKAVRFAIAAQRPFEVGAILREGFTLVGAAASKLSAPLAPAARAASPSRRLRVTLLGAGTVGLGVLRHLESLHDHFEIVSVLCRDHAKAVAAGVSPALLRRDWRDALDTPSDLIVEALGGLEPAGEAIRAALTSGRDVVTANKAVLAEHGTELRTLAAANGRTLLGSACVGGSTPILETLARLSTIEIDRVEGVINATSNYILNAVHSGRSFVQALSDAQAAGFAEADPSRDLNGLDVADKLCLIARTAFGSEVPTATVNREPLNDAEVRRVTANLKPGQRVRYVGWAKRTGESVRAGVELRVLEAGHPLNDLPHAANAAIVYSGTQQQTITGSGAGRWPTAQAVIADVIETWLRRRDSVEHCGEHRVTVPHDAAFANLTASTA